VRGVWRAAHGLAPKAIGIERVLPDALQFVILTAGLIGFMAFRGIDVWRALGLGQVSLPRVVLLGFGLILAAFPGVLLGSSFMQFWLQTSAQKQELVTLFEQVVRAADRAGITQILVAGAIIAPVCEEFLFRGLFYPTFKRYLGAVPERVADFRALLRLPSQSGCASKPLPARALLRHCLRGHWFVARADDHACAFQRRTAPVSLPHREEWHGNMKLARYGEDR
jgi:hypothetical protein